MDELIAIRYNFVVKKVAYASSAAKDLKAYQTMAKRIMQAVRDYADDQQAHANSVTRLTGSSAKRMRVGAFRVIFEEDADTIVVTKIGPRGNVYEGA